MILQEPVTYKTVSQTPYFAIYGLYTYMNTYIGTPMNTLSPENSQNTHTSVQIYGHYEKFSSPTGKIYGLIFQDYSSLLSFTFIQRCDFYTFILIVKKRKSPSYIDLQQMQSEYPCWLTRVTLMLIQMFYKMLLGLEIFR